MASVLTQASRVKYPKKTDQPVCLMELTLKRTNLDDAVRTQTPLRWLATLAAAAVAAPSLAQEAPVAPAQPAASQAGLAKAAPASAASSAPEEVTTVVVTANKRKQRRQEIAGTVSSISGAALEADGVVDVEGVLRRTPGVQTNKGDPDQSLPTIRGIGTVTSTGAIGLQQSTTGVYIEDVPFTDPVGVNSTPDLAPFDLEGIDILRGPQGALYGSSSLGGAVRYTLNKPDLKRFAFSALADVAGVEHGGADHAEYAMMNVPLANQVAGLRAVVFDRQDSGYIDNLGTVKKDANALHQRGGRVIGEFKPAAGLKVTATLLSQQTQVSDGFATGPDAGQLTISTPTPSARDDHFTLANLQVESDLGGYTLTSSTSVVSKKNDGHPDETATFGDIGTVVDLPTLPVVDGPLQIHSRAFSQELRIASPADSRLNYVAGLFFQRYADRFSESLNAPGGAALLGEDAVPGDVLYTENDRDVATEKAAFADADYQVSDAFSIGLGGRYYRNEKHTYSDSHLLDSIFGPLAPDDMSNQQSGFTPKFNVKYKFDGAVWFAAASKGYRFGGTNYGTHTPYKSDSLWSYETGLHMTPSRTLSVDATTYLVKWNDAQVNAQIGTGALAFNGIANVGKATITGLELAANWSPVSELSLTASGAYIDARTTSDFTSSAGTDVPSGTRLPGTARLQTSLEGTYRFDGPADSSGRFTVTHSFMGKRTTNIDKPGELAAYGQLDARVALSWVQWEVAAYVNNLADSHGSSGGTTMESLAGNQYSLYYPIKPRTIGVSLRFDY